MSNLEGKQILYIGSKFFNYENEIIKELTSLGSTVDFFDQRPDNNFLTKVFVRLNFTRLIQKKITKHYNYILDVSLNKAYDYIFLISPEAISKEDIIKLKYNHPNSKLVVYMWDSVANKKHLLNYKELIDDIFSFDTEDCLEYNFKFLPLFYINSYLMKPLEINEEIKYKLSFSGTIHSDRYDFVQKVKKQLGNQSMLTYTYFYSPSKLLFSIQKYIYKNFLNVDTKDVSFQSLNQKDILKIVENSEIILDIERPRQVGLTMRTIEVLASQRKLITTNKNIKDYDFYNTNNILIIDRSKPIISQTFLESNFKPIPKEIYNSYSLGNWIKTIFK